MNVTTHEERGGSRSALDARLDEVRALRDLTDAGWERTAGCAPGYLKQQRFRSRRDPSFRLPEDGAEALARAARVSVAWLRHGQGPREEEAPAVAPPPTDTTEAELAVLEALRREPERWTAEDAREALRLVRAGRQLLPRDRERAVAGMARFLAAVARARRGGAGPVTFESIAWTASVGAEDTDGDRELAALGAERPARPATPPGGTPSRKK